MKNILFYGPINNRSRDNETLMLAFEKKGYKVFFITQLEGHEIVNFLNENGVQAFSFQSKTSNRLFSFIKHLLYIIPFCYKHKINIVFSHLEPANFIASIAQFFIKAKVYLVRHHINEAKLYSFDKSLSYQLTYLLAKRIIVVSDHAKRYMVKEEGISSNKIQHINLAYDFSLYAKPDIEKSNEIRKEIDAQVVLISICRFTKYKRPDLSIFTLNELVNKNIDAKLILLGQGEMKEEMEVLIDKLNLQGKVFMKGYVNNVLDYLLASDFLLHPSLLDSSCVVVKEAGLVQKPVITCEGVGDFDEYIIHKENGFKVSSENFIEEASALVSQYYTEESEKNRIGKNLQKSILNLFDINVVLPEYLKILQEE